MYLYIYKLKPFRGGRDRLCDNFGKIQLRHTLPRNLSATVWDADGGIGVPKRQIRSCLVHIKGEGGGLSFASKGNQSICKGRKDRVGQISKKNYSSIAIFYGCQCTV